MIAQPPAPERTALGEQFGTFEQQHQSEELGMWIFLATEVMLFGGLFTAYTVYSTVYPAGFSEGSRHLDVLLGSVNTAILIISSLMMSLAVRAAQLGQQRALTRYLLGTALLGVLFLAVKGLEYQKHFVEGMVPGLVWHYVGPFPNQVELFFFAYFVMTGLHSVHLGMGIAAVLLFAIRARRDAFPVEHHAPVEMLGLYWHFVDVVWIFLLPLLYLPGLSS